MGPLPDESALAAGTAAFATVPSQGIPFQGDSSHRKEILVVAVAAASSCGCHEVRPHAAQTSGDWMDALAVAASCMLPTAFWSLARASSRVEIAAVKWNQSRLGRDSKDTDTTSRGLEGLLEPK